MSYLPEDVGRDGMSWALPGVPAETTIVSITSPTAATVEPDPELMAAWREWWDALPYVIDTEAAHDAEPEMDDDTWMAGRDLASLEAHLAEHGFAIVRRMDPDLPG